MHNRRALALLALVAMISACTAGAPESSPVSSRPAVAGTASPEPTASTTSSPDPATSPAVVPTAAADLSFMSTTFGTPARQSAVHDVIDGPGGLIAIGVEYEGHLPILGPTPPHEGRIWTSADARAWEDVTPGGLFTNVTLGTLFRRSDSSLVLTGTEEQVSVSGPSEYVYRVWESSDGVTWQPGTTGLPDDRQIMAVEQGARGILARVWPVGATHGTELWFSTDGRTWEFTRQLSDGSFGFDAGDEGFAVAGVHGPYGGEQTPFAIASADGIEWVESASPPPGEGDLAAIGGDWIRLSVTRDADLRPVSASTWRSGNGLDWAAMGEVPLEQGIGEGDCVVEPSIDSVGPWVVLRSHLGGLCSEGGLVNPGPQLLSFEGVDWVELPFPPAGEEGTGSLVNASAVVDGILVLAGSSHGQASFWVGEGR